MEQHTGRRRRPALSCVQCRRRKIKCDRTNPCNHCVSAQTPCVYKVYNSDTRSHHRSAESDASRQITHSADPTSSPSAATLHASVIQLVTDRNSFPSESQSTTVTPIRSYDTQTPGHATGSGTDLQDLRCRVARLEQAANSHPPCEERDISQELLARQSSMYDAQSSSDKTRILRWSRWADTAPEFRNIYACFTQTGSGEENASPQDEEVGTSAVQIRELLHQCKDVARRTKVNRPSRNLSRLELDLDLPSRVVADTMIEIYFRSFESVHRILHVPTFQAEYQRCWERPGSIAIDVRLRILLVIGLGSSLSDYADTDTNFRNLVHQWVYAAQTWWSGPLEKNRLELGGIQIHCLTILARQIFSIGGDLIWMSMGSLLHSAMQIGLHRSAKHLPAMSVLQVELRRRLWATILEMVLQSSLDSAMPPRISLDEFDIEPPSNIDDDEIDQSTIELQVASRVNFTATSMQLLLLDSLPTRLRILRLLNGMHSEISYTDVLALSSEISNACRKCSHFLNSSASSGVTSFHKSLLDYLVRRFLISLHCPFASKARDNPLFFYSLKVSLDTALATVSPEQDKDFSRLMAIGGGSFREGFRTASTVVSIELLAQVQGQCLEGTLQHQTAYRNFLKQAMNHMIAFSAERIRQGETNVKSHLFLSMVMAEVGATETGVSIQSKISQSARDSLQFCYDLLQTRSAMDPSSGVNSDLPMNLIDYQEDFEYDFDSLLMGDGFP